MRRWTLRIVALAVIVIATGAYWMHGGTRRVPADINQPERAVSGQTLTSAHTPAITMDFAPGFVYAGAQRFLLYGVASAEQHFFVDAGPDKRIRRLYWVQFEGYLPGNQHTYDYSEADGRAQISGLDFYTDTVARVEVPPQRIESDGARARELLRARGYIYPAEILGIRLVHLLDGGRNELMIIYLEDLSLFGIKADAVDEARMKELSADILAKAQQGMKITRKKVSALR